jgi:hypothetical protein
MRHMAVGQSKEFPSVTTALQMLLPTELARIAAVAHSWRAEVSVVESVGLKNDVAY